MRNPYDVLGVTEIGERGRNQVRLPQARQEIPSRSEQGASSEGAFRRGWIGLRDCRGREKARRLRPRRDRRRGQASRAAIRRLRFRPAAAEAGIPAASASTSALADSPPAARSTPTFSPSCSDPADAARAHPAPGLPRRGHRRLGGRAACDRRRMADRSASPFRPERRSTQPCPAGFEEGKVDPVARPGPRRPARRARPAT